MCAGRRLLWLDRGFESRRRDRFELGRKRYRRGNLSNLLAVRGTRLMGCCMPTGEPYCLDPRREGSPYCCSQDARANGIHCCGTPALWGRELSRRGRMAILATRHACHCWDHRLWGDRVAKEGSWKEGRVQRLAAGRKSREGRGRLRMPHE